MQCPYCGEWIPDNSVFCEKCGKKIAQTFCVNCGTQLEPGAKFCPVCGASQGEEAMQEQQAEPVQAQEDPAFDETSTTQRKWWVLIVIVVAAAVVVVLLAAWWFGVFDRAFTRQETVEVTEEVSAPATQLTVLTTTMEFDEAGLTSRIYYETDVENPSEITWSSSDTTVAIVDENGYVTSLGSGTAVITAQCGNLNGTCMVYCDFSTESASSGSTGSSGSSGSSGSLGSSGSSGTTSASGSNSYLCSYSSSRLITSSDLNAIASTNYGSLPAGESLAQMIINEIYAKHGYRFSTPSIQAYFDQKTWYQQIGSYSSDPNVIIKRFNSIEKQNVEFLKDK